mgnify:CR=1 FL=1
MPQRLVLDNLRAAVSKDLPVLSAGVLLIGVVYMVATLLAGDTRYPFRLQCEQRVLTRMADDLAHKTANLQVRYGAELTGLVQDDKGVTVTVNTPENTEYAVEVAKAVSGQVDADTPPLMGAEDFSFMLNERPGAYIFVGNGDTAMVHHPAYNFDDNVIPFGASWYAGMVETRMPAA